MSEADNIKVVQSAYAAFGKGDIPALLEIMDPNVDWHGMVGVGPNVPTGGPRHGKAEVGRFFQQVTDTVTFKTFEPRDFLAKGDTVVTLGVYSGVVKTTGRTFDLEWVMVMTLKGGKVVKFREYTDAAAVNAAY
jgi:hypothetical protein